MRTLTIFVTKSSISLLNGYNLKQKLTVWVEEYLFFPTPFQQIISFLLLPFTLLYMLIIAFKRVSAKPIYFGIPVISIGNIIVGGSGKTPVTIALAKSRKDVAVVLRGYGRKSQGMYVISQKGKIKEDISVSGDEAMLLAKALPNATVIVAEKREEGILKAKELGCKLVFLDDGFSKYKIAKFDILLRPKKEPTNVLCLPSGGYREPKMMYSMSNMTLLEGKDFSRLVTYKKDGQTISALPQKLVVVTAISKADRLLEFLPEGTELIAFPDHYNFTQIDMDVIQNTYPDYSFITTAKDMVKIDELKMRDLYLMDLEIQLEPHVDFTAMENYIAAYHD